MRAYLARRRKLSLRESPALTESIQSSAAPTSQNLGFRRDNIVVVSTNRRMTASGRESLAEALRRHPGILDVALANDVPLSGSKTVAQMRLPGRQGYLTMDRK